MAEQEIKVMVGMNYAENSRFPDVEEMFVEQVYWPMPAEGYASEAGMLELNNKDELEAWAERKFDEFGIYSVKVDADQPLPW